MVILTEPYISAGGNKVTPLSPPPVQSGNNSTVYVGKEGLGFQSRSPELSQHLLADHLVLLSDSRKGMERTPQILETFRSDGLKVNRANAMVLCQTRAEDGTIERSENGNHGGLHGGVEGKGVWQMVQPEDPGVGVEVFRADKISNSWLREPTRARFHESEMIMGLQLRTCTLPTLSTKVRVAPVPYCVGSSSRGSRLAGYKERRLVSETGSVGVPDLVMVKGREAIIVDVAICFEANRDTLYEPENGRSLSTVGSDWQ
ncbi:uncharacterized protein AKAME5_002525200 [Lates japonicus]|uniref:Uncharacterized protein n=1 Tax=Lates japonicus TaxID=270547 RepID=A0AAD3NMS5_LATJO|nr:uncharacterized protein AKAME5_002525200 [Lates japonicus]